jgi:hypothetical protein
VAAATRLEAREDSALRFRDLRKLHGRGSSRISLMIAEIWIVLSMIGHYDPPFSDQ